MEDTISRQALLDKFEPWLKVKNYNDGELNMLKAILYEIRFMPPATDTNVGTKLGTNLAEVGTDCISRQAAVDAINEYMVGKRCDTDGTMMARLINELVINKLPPAQPKRGKWIEYNYPGSECVYCDQCKTEYYPDDLFLGGIDYPNFCPDCGADMREVTT